MKNRILLNKNLLLVIQICLIIFPVIAKAQQGLIGGRVYDEKTNEGLPFVNLIIDGTTIGSTTDLEGNFRFTGIQPGYVRLRVSAVGYEPRLSPEFLVTNNRTANIDIGLQEKTVDLEVVDVTASQFERRDESPLSLRRLGIREIERSPGSNRDISRVIQTLPGVASTPAFRNDVIIRGGGPAENSFYLDGMEIPNINHFATQGASGGPVGILNTDFIRELEMYSGAFPANRGNAMSSVFEFRQINGNSDKLNFQGTFGASDLALTADGPLGPNTTFIASARRSYLQFLFGIIGLPFLPTYNGFQFKTNTRIGENATLSFIGLGAIDLFDLNLDANETEEQRNILEYLPVNEQWNYAIGAVYRRFRTNGSETWVLSRNMLRNMAYKYPDNNESFSRIFDYTSDEIENKLRYERSLRLGAYQFVLGAGTEYARYNNATYRQFFILNEPDTLAYASAFDLFKWSVFAQATRRVLNERLILSLGLRTDANSYSSHMNNLTEQISPRFSASYALQQNLFLNFNTGRYYQLPPYTTMGFKNNEGTLVNRQNGLSYISSDHVVAGFEYIPGRLSNLTLEGFYKTYANYPFSLTDSIALGSRSADYGIVGDEEVASTGTGRAYGAELFYRNQDLYGFNLILSYTYVRSSFKNKSGLYIPSAWDNRHILNLTGLRQLGANWEIGFKWSFTGGTPYTPYDLDRSSRIQAWGGVFQGSQGLGYLDFSRFNSERLTAYHQLDLRVDKQFFFNNFSLLLYLDIQNVYDFKASQPPAISREVDDQGNPIVFDDDGIMRYRLRLVENSIGSVIPSIGIIFVF